MDMPCQGSYAPHFAKHFKRKHYTRGENNNYIFKEKYSVSTGVIPIWLLCYAGVGLSAMLCYVNSLSGELVHDDLMSIRSNADVRPETPITQLFAHDFWGRAMSDRLSHKSYRPLCVLTFRLNYMLSGLVPFGYHAVNVALHSLASLLFTYVCHTTIFYSNMRLSGLAGLVFAVHPVHTEAVSGIVGRADVLCGVFFLVSFIAYYRCILADLLRQEAKFWIWLLTSVLLAMCAMLSKEQGITVIGVCVLYDISLTLFSSRVPSGRADWKLYLCRAVPLLRRVTIGVTCAFILLGFRLWMLNGQLPIFAREDNPASFEPKFQSRVLSYWYIYASNACLLIYPAVLSYDWQMGSIPIVHQLHDSRNLASVVFITTLLTLFYHARKHHELCSKRRVLFGIALMVLPFFPASNAFFRVGFVMAERVLYIPSMGFSVLLIHVWDETLKRLPHNSKNVIQMAMVLLCALWGCRTLMRNQVWQNRHALFSSGIQTLPDNAKMHYNYANLLRDKGKKELAIEHFRSCLHLWPSYSTAHNNLALLLSNNTEAKAHFRTAIKYQPCHVNAHVNIGVLLSNDGSIDEAWKHLTLAAECDPSSSAVYSGMAALYHKTNDFRNAEKYYRRALLGGFGDPQNHHNLAVFLEQLGRVNEALESYKEAYLLDSSQHTSLRSAAKILKNLDRIWEARNLFDRAVSVSRDAETLDMAGVFYFNVGSVTRAIELFREAMRRDNSDSHVLLHLAQALSSEGDLDAAGDLIQHYQQTHNFHSLPFTVQQANIYGQKGQHQQAIDALKGALALTSTKQEAAAIHLQIGKHLRDLNFLEKSFMHYQEAVGQDPSLSEAQHGLAVYYHKMGNIMTAKHHYTEAQRLDPNNLLLKENFNRLLESELETNGHNAPGSSTPATHKPTTQQRSEKHAADNDLSSNSGGSNVTKGHTVAGLKDLAAGDSLESDSGTLPVTAHIHHSSLHGRP